MGSPQPEHLGNEGHKKKKITVKQKFSAQKNLEKREQEEDLEI